MLGFILSLTPCRAQEHAVLSFQEAVSIALGAPSRYFPLRSILGPLSLPDDPEHRLVHGDDYGGRDRI